MRRECETAMIETIRTIAHGHLDNLKTGLRFSAVGMLASLIHVGTAILLRAVLAIDPVIASTLGFCAAFLFSFTGHYKYSFAAKGPYTRYFLKFIVTSLVSFLSSTLIVWAGTTQANINEYIIIISLVFIIPLLNFITSKFWVFKN